MQKTITHYPSPKNFQRTNDREVPLRWGISYLQDLFKQIPAEEQDGATMTWPPTVAYPHTLSPMEVMEDRRAQAVAWLQNLPRTGADPEALAELKAILGA